MTLDRRILTTIPKGHPGPRVALFGTWNEAYKPLAEIALPNWLEYCTRHGYALVGYPNAFHLDPSRPETYGDKCKFELYYDVRGHCDIAMFLDIDALIMNQGRKIEDALSFRPFLWTYDDNGPCSGFWIARTDELTERHLRYAYERAARHSNIRNGVIEPNGISDQDSMRDLMNVPPFSRTFGTTSAALYPTQPRCMPAELIGHCYESNYKPGDWLLTFPGISVEEKREKMLKWTKDRACSA